MTDWLRLGSILEFCAVYFTTQLMRCAAFSFVLIHEKGNMVDDPGKPSRISYVKIMQKGKFILFLAGFISF